MSVVPKRYGPPVQGSSNIVTRMPDANAPTGDVALRMTSISFVLHDCGISREKPHFAFGRMASFRFTRPTKMEMPPTA